MAVALAASDDDGRDLAFTDLLAQWLGEMVSSRAASASVKPLLTHTHLLQRFGDGLA